MTKEYCIGPRFNKIKYLSVGVNSAIVFMFYFVYRYVFAGRLGALEGWPLAAIFAAIEFVVVFATLKVADKYASSISYRVTDEGLVYRMGKKEQLLRWKDFSSAILRELRFTGVHPVEFKVAGRTLMLNQYTADLCRLTDQVFDHIEDHIAIAPELRKHTRDLTGIY